MVLNSFVVYLNLGWIMDITKAKIIKENSYQTIVESVHLGSPFTSYRMRVSCSSHHGHFLIAYNKAQ